jgi:protein-S-isoprenylcysteine O-methyltransferase Ste14
LKNVFHSFNAAFVADFVGRILLVVCFGALATLHGISIVAMFKNPSGPPWLEVAGRFASFGFVSLIVGMAIFRLRPIRIAAGIEPRLSAFAGTFLSLALVALPTPNLGTGLHIFGLILILVGGVLSVCVLLWLGRSFSIEAQSRRLVTAGPYAFVRHPLYLCEEIAIIGIAIIHFSVEALVIVGVQWLFQLRRMTNEEAVLHVTFSEYADYASHTPKIIPDAFRRLTKLARRDFD